MEQHNARLRPHPARQKRDMFEMVRQRMEQMSLCIDDYHCGAEKAGTISFVIINPSFDLPLELDDVIYVLKPPVTEQTKGFKVLPRRGLKRNCSLDESAQEAVNCANSSIPTFVIS